MPDESKNLTLDEIREVALRLNGPDVPIEVRQRALTSLLVEALNRFVETTTEVTALRAEVTALRNAIGQRVRKWDAEIKDLSDKLEAKAAPAAAAVAAPAELVDKGKNGGKKKASAPVEEAPAVSAPPVVPPAGVTDPAAIALGMAGVGGVPTAPIIKTS